MTTRKFGAISLVVGIAILSSQPRTASADALAAFVGSWSGSGTITVQDGTRERIRCRGAHKSNQSNGTLTLGLRCASDSYKFELQSDITYDGGNISGSWNEVTRQVHGSISGRATSNQIQAQASAIGFNASQIGRAHV